MPSRRTHTNSHHGCLQCKKSRVKCDQTQPRCVRCGKKNQQCTYQHLTSSYDPFKHVKNSPNVSNQHFQPLKPEDSSKSADSQTQILDGGLSLAATHEITFQASARSFSITTPYYGTGIPELDPVTHRLLHHYINHLSPLLTSDQSQSENLPLFHAAINRHWAAQSHVQHTLLTFSALHIASITLDPRSPGASSQHLVTALSHKSTAIEQLRPVVGSLTSKTFEPALATSGLLIACAFALPLAGASSDPVDLLTQIASLFQGTAALFRLGGQDSSVLDSSTSPKIRRSVMVASANEVSWPGAEEAVDQVISVVFSMAGRSEGCLDGRKEILMDAALKLKVALRRVAASPGVYFVATMWIGMVLREFIDRVRQHDPLALVLLADWSVCLKGTRHVWWTQGWAERTIEAVWRDVGESHRHLLVWAAAEAGVSNMDT